MDNFKSNIEEILESSQKIEDSLSNLLSKNAPLVIFYLAKISIEDGKVSKQSTNSRLKKLYKSKFLKENFDQFLKTPYYEIFINSYVHFNSKWENEIIKKHFEKDKVVLLKAIKLKTLVGKNQGSKSFIENRNIISEYFPDYKDFENILERYSNLEKDFKAKIINQLNTLNLFQLLFLCGENLRLQRKNDFLHFDFFQRRIIQKINVILNLIQFKSDNLEEYTFVKLFGEFATFPSSKITDEKVFQIAAKLLIEDFPIDIEADSFKEFCLTDDFYEHFADLENQLVQVNSFSVEMKLYKMFVYKFRQLNEINSVSKQSEKYYQTIQSVFGYFLPIEKETLPNRTLDFLKELFISENEINFDEIFVSKFENLKNSIDTSKDKVINIYPISFLENLPEEIKDRIVFNFSKKEGKRLDTKNKFLFELNDLCFFFRKTTSNPYFTFSVIDSLIRTSKDPKVETKNLASLISSDLEEKVSELFEKNKFQVIRNKFLNKTLGDSGLSPFPKMEIDLMVKEGNTLLILEIKSSALNGGLSQIFDTYHQNLLKAGLQLSNIEEYLNTDIGKDELRNQFGFSEETLEIKYLIISNHFNYDGTKIFTKYLKTSVFELEAILNDNLYHLYDPLFEIPEKERIGILSVENEDSLNYEYYNKLTLDSFPNLKTKMQEKYKLFDGDKSLINVYKKLEEKVVWWCLNSSQK
ncbi:hypothetical protein EHQ16_15630 [Leptospira kanakyensis]|uniref:Uncharacterized protein n=1 Tax=Leptospira kanakyensis TaxID=2484968 RepID=A0A6N4QA96_9LEPT|nr:hypothetical protein [Leptospira kanakyensis]TGK53506.1 hypothetical protein EHQ11_03940 [Leptospira kanakyensis]TGK57300.1 hypothetical protein EHQ16_15630 [Leptospira kanakyensis]TGK73012.1 hypothetical protein EHQ18_04015 [Leptospira kanakyensis]